MKEQIVSFELAKLAKEKGFNIESDKYYCIVPIEEQKVGDVVLEEETYTHIAMGKGEAAWFRYAPITSQTLLQKWLREEHNIHIVIDVAYNGKGILEGYTHVVYGNATKKMDVLLAYIQEPWFVDTYEEALEVGLEEALKLMGNGDKNKV